MGNRKLFDPYDVNTISTHFILRPAIVTDDADMQIVANRVAFGKFFNAGQVRIQNR